MYNHDILSKLKDLDPFYNTEYCRLDDLGTSKLFIEVYKGKILYNTSTKSFPSISNPQLHRITQRRFIWDM